MVGGAYAVAVVSGEIGRFENVACGDTLILHSALCIQHYSIDPKNFAAVAPLPLRGQAVGGRGLSFFEIKTGGMTH